jgi:hypothetical protein
VPPPPPTRRPPSMQRPCQPTTDLRGADRVTWNSGRHHGALYNAYFLSPLAVS